MSETPAPPSPPNLLPPQPVRPTSNMAIAALIVGIISLFVCQLGGIAAIILGRSARTEIRNSQGQLGGDGMALAGEILGWIELAIVVLVVILVIGFFVLAGASIHEIVNRIQVTPAP